ncbi:MAG: superoxide dismutase, partial [Phycisphaerales bacterium JB059]
MSEISRRQALGTLAAGAGAMGFGSVALSRETLGWNDQTGSYELPPLPYAPNALAPHIDEQTMLIHHGKHHAGYVRGLNNALDQLHNCRANGNTAEIQHWERQLSFHAGGHINHTLFWSGMAPEGKGGGGRPTGALANQIERDFGTFDRMLWQFKAAAKSVEGSGWGWLVWEPLGERLLVTQMENQQKMMFAGAVPLLGVDV